MDERTKPCEAPCPKCGGSDVHRKYYPRNTVIQNASYNKVPHPGFVVRGWESFTNRDLIVNCCRCCEFAWATKPLTKPKSPVSASREQEQT